MDNDKISNNLGESFVRVVRLPLSTTLYGEHTYRAVKADTQQNTYYRKGGKKYHML